MLDLQNILEQFLTFLTTQDKAWSLCTIPFLVTFIVFFAIYLVIQRSRRILMMGYVVAFSLFFAYKANGILMLLLPATALLSWWLTKKMNTCEGWKRRLWLIAIILLTLAPLLYYKYANFLLTTLNDILAGNFALLDIFLPVGISFYTFQAISYSVDVYKRKFTLETSLLEYTFYLTFFPLLMAGPITRAEVLIPQLKAEPNKDKTFIYGGLWLIIVGLLNIIPFFGPFIGLVPSALIILMVDPAKALIFIVFIIILQQIDGNLIGPRILGSSTGITGFWVMFSIILGSGLFGFWGMLLGVPVFVVIYTLITKLIVKKLKRSDLPWEIADYREIDYIDPATLQVVKKASVRREELKREQERRKTARPAVVEEFPPETVAASGGHADGSQKQQDVTCPEVREET